VVDVGDLDAIDGVEVLRGGAAAHDQIVAPVLDLSHARQDRDGAYHILKAARKTADLGVALGLDAQGLVADRFKIVGLDGDIRARQYGLVEADLDLQRFDRAHDQIGFDDRFVADDGHLQTDRAFGNAVDGKGAVDVGDGAQGSADHLDIGTDEGLTGGGVKDVAGDSAELFGRRILSHKRTRRQDYKEQDKILFHLSLEWSAVWYHRA